MISEISHNVSNSHRPQAWPNSNVIRLLSGFWGGWSYLEQHITHPSLVSYILTLMAILESAQSDTITIKPHLWTMSLRDISMEPKSGCS